MAERVVVASDRWEVLDAVADLPVDVCLTSGHHRSGTERVAEVAARSEYSWADRLLNVQGDEPFFPLAGVAGAIAELDRGRSIGTVGGLLTSRAAVSADRVKVVVDGVGRALRFSRSLPASAAWGCEVTVLEHVGLYAYTRGALVRWVAAEPVPEEHVEALEQLRPLALGLSIGVARIEGQPPPAVDTLEDLSRAERFLDSQHVRVGR
jgi:3-deoxy-manno-octulosonate cytidylyltransferase (CMP-KDO synthetase)